LFLLLTRRPQRAELLLERAEPLGQLVEHAERALLAILRIATTLGLGALAIRWDGAAAAIASVVVLPVVALVAIVALVVVWLILLLARKATSRGISWLLALIVAVVTIIDLIEAAYGVIEQFTVAGIVWSRQGYLSRTLPVAGLFRRLLSRESPVISLTAARAQDRADDAQCQDVVVAPAPAHLLGLGIEDRRAVEGAGPSSNQFHSEASAGWRRHRFPRLLQRRRV